MERKNVSAEDFLTEVYKQAAQNKTGIVNQNSVAEALGLKPATVYQRFNKLAKQLEARGVKNIPEMSSGLTRGRKTDFDALATLANDLAKPATVETPVAQTEEVAG